MNIDMRLIGLGHVFRDFHFGLELQTLTLNTYFVITGGDDGGGSGL